MLFFIFQQTTNKKFNSKLYYKTKIYLTLNFFYLLLSLKIINFILNIFN